MITNNQAQEGIIDWLKVNATILALSNNYPDEIRETYWQGEKFLFPNIRVSCEITPAQNSCGPDNCIMVISCYSEEKSSKEAQEHAGTVANQLHNKQFTETGVRYSAIKVTRTPRAVQEGGLWKADVEISMKVN